MDITSYIQSHRSALLIADHATYRSQLSRQILTLRKRLGRATPKREKFQQKPITSADIAGNHEFAHLLILVAERAWAHAMHIKSSHAEGEAITGNARSMILTKLWKASKGARELVGCLRELGKERERDLLEARAYLATLEGAGEFERQAEGAGGKEAEKWEKCLKSWSEARVVYAALYAKEGKEVFREVLANTVDPTIRYAAYQAQLSRTVAMETVARKYFPRDDEELVRLVQAEDGWALKEKPKAKEGEAKGEPALQEVPDSVQWRGRKANIVDAAIGQAMAAVTAAEAKLKSYLQEHPDVSAREKAAAYDDVLIASQDAADAAKRATDELEKERVDEGDARMQDLRVTSLAVNYDLVSWRVGRNRILIGDKDGLTLETQKPKRPRTRNDGTELPAKEEPRARKLARLRERIVLYDATIQSVESVKELRGAMRDEAFVRELESKTAYFRALKCINIALSHSLLGSHLNALALLKRGQELLTASPPPSSNTADTSLPTLEIPTSTTQNLKTHLSTLLSRTHALVELQKLQANSATAAEKNMVSAAPLVQNLNAYPTPGTQVDLKNLVDYPPKIQPVPVKPLFLDVAWNYIEYPGRKSEVAAKVAPVANGGGDQMDVDGEEKPQPQPEKKRGWFGFGR